MKIASSFLLSVANQPSLRADKDAAQTSVQQLKEEAVKNSEDNPNLVVGEVETVLEQAQARREIIDLRALQEEPLPLNNLRALSSYQSIASAPDDPTGLARLDIIV